MYMYIDTNRKRNENLAHELMMNQNGDKVVSLRPWLTWKNKRYLLNGPKIGLDLDNKEGKMMMLLEYWTTGGEESKGDGVDDIDDGGVMEGGCMRESNNILMMGFRGVAERDGTWWWWWY